MKVRPPTDEIIGLDSEIQVLKLQVYSNKDLLITSELAAEGVRRDRDLAITELRAAHCTIEYYKREKKTLKAEVKQLKEEKEALKARLTANYVDETDDQECPWLELAKSESEGMDFSLGLGPSISQAGNAQHGEKSSADLTYMTLPNVRSSCTTLGQGTLMNLHYRMVK